MVESAREPNRSWMVFCLMSLRVTSWVFLLTLWTTAISPGFMPSLLRTSWGMVTWPLVDMVVGMLMWVL